MSDRNRAFTRPLKNANSNASDYVNNLRAKVKFAGTSNLARTVATQGGMLPLRTPQGHLKPYQGTYGFSATTVTANSPKTYCLNTSRSYRDLLDITKGKYLLTPPNPVANTITIDNTEPSELYNGVFFENVYKGNAESIYSTTGFGIDNNNIIYATSNPLAPSNSNQLIFVDPSYNMFYESQSCLEDSTYFRNIQIRTDLGVTGKEHLDRVLNLYLLNGFKYPSKFSLDYNSGDCINANNLLQTPPVPAVPPCPPCSLNTIAIEGPANTWTTSSIVTILPCQTLTILAGQTLNINNNFNNYGTIQNSGTIYTNNGTFTNYNGGIINNNVGGIIYNNVGAGTILNDLGGTINNNGTIYAGLFTAGGNSGTINNNATGSFQIQVNTFSNNGIITNNTGGVITVSIGVGLTNNGILTNHIGATITSTNSLNSNNSGTFTNYGIITLDSTSGFQIFAPLINDGTSATITNAGTFTNFSGGTITNTNSATITNNSGATIINTGGTITNTNSATITNNSGATITNGVAFSGGIINNQNSGIITNNAGATFANVAIFNNYSLTESAVFTNNGTYTGNAPILL